MKKKVTIEFTLEPKDVGTIKKCLDYCFHRLTKHEGTGLHQLVDPNEVVRIRKEMNK